MMQSTQLQKKLKAIGIVFGDKLPSKDLDNAVAACGDDQAAILTPHNAAHAFAAHNAVRSDLLCADTLVEGPETNGCVMACGNGFAPVFAEREGGNSGGMGEHLVSTLT
jgi:hypothetical protein